MPGSAAVAPDRTAATSEIVLRDGSTVHVRPTGPGDEAVLYEFFERLSPEARWFRFIGAGIDLRRTARRLVRDGVGLFALAGLPARVIAHACFMPEAPGRAEVAFAVDDEWQGQGIATILLAHLAQLAEARGVSVFTATLAAENHRMLTVLRDSGFPIEVHSEPGELLVEMPAQLGPEARARFEERDAIAAVAAVSHVLRPASIAVIGASRHRGSIGGTVVRNLVRERFAGELYPVNPHAKTIGGRTAYPSLEEVPGDIELAVVALAAEGVAGAARACAERGVRALVVLSAGFTETGAEGKARQAELLGVCRDAGMRLVGPNCLGVLNTEEAVRLDATFAPGRPPAGRVAFASQSGAYGIAALELAARRGLGISSFVSLGDKADLSSNDFLRFWERDDRTDVILLYLESMGNPRRFGQIARRLTAAKPVIAVKSGRSRAGRRAASSHTGALLEASEATVDALFDHAGVIRVATLDEQLDVAELLAGQPLPRGDRVAIVTNAGGPGIACADACAAAGLRVEPLGRDTTAALRRILPAAAAVGNPVDMLAAATGREFRRAIELVARDPGVDAIVAIFIPPLPGRRSDPVLRAMGAGAATAARAATPVLAVMMPPSTPSSEAPLPVYETPEQAARALGHAARYARRRRRPVDDAALPAGIDADRAAAVVARGLSDGGGWLGVEATEELLRAYSVPLAASRIADSPQAAGRAADELGGAVALKAIVPGLLHKRDADGVRLGLQGAAEVSEAAAEMGSALGAERFLVQEMAPDGVEMLVGVAADARFGPVVACGAGGTAVELLGDVEVRLAPVSRREAAEMVHELRTFPLLDGYRGAPRADVAALEDVIVRIGALASLHPAVAELDLNPVIVTPTGAVAVDARIRLAPVPPQAPYPSVGA
jgi:acyl-CoA synthetase (NDP forming)/GNAT superfamily N-acetyltransferase